MAPVSGRARLRVIVLPVVLDAVALWAAPVLLRAVLLLPFALDTVVLRVPPVLPRAVLPLPVALETAHWLRSCCCMWCCCSPPSWSRKC